ncbi:MAG: AMP-binding protein [Acidimicrobiia bacterium]|nr:AMP-binding protein [Acidimicrobiia bacterium]
MSGYGVAAHAVDRPDKVALVHHDRRITYRELDELITRASHVLRNRGVGPDARLGIALGNRPEWFVAALGAARLGAEIVPVPSGATDDEREYFSSDGEVAFMLDEAELPTFLDALHGAPTGAIADPRPDYVTLRAYTSGTTGRPKAVVRPTVDAAASIEGLVRYYTAYGLDSPDEVNITGSPVHHIAGFSGPHSGLLLGHTSVILDHFDAGQWFETVSRERATYSWCAPVHLYRLMSAPDDVKAAADVSSIKRLLHGSAPCAPSLKREVIEFFPSGAVWETYGGTETMGTVITAEEWLAKPGSVGRAAPGSTIKIYDDDGEELPAGEVGLVYIGSDWGRGFRYAGDAELTESVYRGNLATLGDLGYLDDDGYLFVVDRRKDMVITGGANVYPAEVEAVLVTHPAIEEVAVVGLPDDEYGEIVVAVVVVTPGTDALDADDVIVFAREHLVRYKAPRRVEFVAELPRSPMGKVLKRELRTTFSRPPRFGA